MEDLISRDSSITSASDDVVLLVEGRYLSQQQPAGMLAALRARGHPIRVIDPEADAYLLGENNWLDGVKLVVCRGRSVALQFLIRWAESRNIPCINPREAIAAVFNKAEMSVALAAGGIPTPITFLGQLKDLANRIPEATYPLVLKPVYGDNCRGLRIVRSSVEMSRTNWPETLAIAQHFHPTEGYDLKLYGIGKEVWAVRKPSCLATALSDPTLPQGQAPPHPVPLTQALETLALRCADLFGLELFGVDCIETPEGVYVIEVNDFPNYSGIPGVDEKLADYVLGRARQGKEGKRR
jgi:ribosomal protein S6--L-glutamate ligase